VIQDVAKPSSREKGLRALQNEPNLRAQVTGFASSPRMPDQSIGNGISGSGGMQMAGRGMGLKTCPQPVLREVRTLSCSRAGLNETLLDLRGSPMRYVPLASQMGAAVSISLSEPLRVRAPAGTALREVIVKGLGRLFPNQHRKLATPKAHERQIVLSSCSRHESPLPFQRLSDLQGQ
jgi:hypothetical protein